MKGNQIVYLSDNGQERGVIHSNVNMTIGQKYLAKQTRASIWVRYVIGRETCLYYFWWIAVSFT